LKLSSKKNLKSSEMNVQWWKSSDIQILSSFMELVLSHQIYVSCLNSVNEDLYGSVFMIRKLSLPGSFEWELLSILQREFIIFIQWRNQFFIEILKVWILFWIEQLWRNWPTLVGQDLKQRKWLQKLELINGWLLKLLLDLNTLKKPMFSVMESFYGKLPQDSLLLKVYFFKYPDLSGLQVSMEVLNNDLRPKIPKNTP